jgi:hypothetical protein
MTGKSDTFLNRRSLAAVTGFVSVALATPQETAMDRNTHAPPTTQFTTQAVNSSFGDHPATGLLDFKPTALNHYDNQGGG